MLLYSAAIVIGLILLVWGADLMVVGASATAHQFGVSPMLVGLTVVGFATSAPEILVAIAAAWSGAPNLAIGNAIGSNIANVGLIGGARRWHGRWSSSRKRCAANSRSWSRSAWSPVIFFFDSELGRLEGLVLLIVFAGFIYWIIQLGMRTRGHDTIEAEYASEIPTDISIGGAIARIGGGLLALSVGAHILVWGCQAVAAEFGVSDMIIGITIVAVGTSLPELAVSLASARKGEHGLAFGNIIGSNGFNSLAVIGIATVIEPAILDPAAIRLHIPVMLGFTITFFLMAYNWSGTIRVGRTHGAALLSAFIAYYAYIAYLMLK